MEEGVEHHIVIYEYNHTGCTVREQEILFQIKEYESGLILRLIS